MLIEKAVFSSAGYGPNGLSSWASLYDTDRKTVPAAGTFLLENRNVARQYSAWLAADDLIFTPQNLSGQGGRCAAWPDGGGTYVTSKEFLHEFSTVCPHLGCLVEWNHSEGTRNCLRHGSRFYKQGGVLNGPANSDLAPVREAVTHSRIPAFLQRNSHSAPPGDPAK